MIAAVTSFGVNANCAGTGGGYRVDTVFALNAAILPFQEMPHKNLFNTLTIHVFYAKMVLTTDKFRRKIYGAHIIGDAYYALCPGPDLRRIQLVQACPHPCTGG
jgi:hypothetical protein